jgi:hypothetical protein
MSDNEGEDEGTSEESGEEEEGCGNPECPVHGEGAPDMRMIPGQILSDCPLENTNEALFGYILKVATQVYEDGERYIPTFLGLTYSKTLLAAVVKPILQLPGGKEVMGQIGRQFVDKFGIIRTAYIAEGTRKVPWKLAGVSFAAGAPTLQFDQDCLIIILQDPKSVEIRAYDILTDENGKKYVQREGKRAKTPSTPELDFFKGVYTPEEA